MALLEALLAAIAGYYVIGCIVGLVIFAVMVIVWVWFAKKIMKRMD